jgi:cellulose synthase/poly-beta-1,6-N-acetylglucosamine synthase-like glycosyltransferase
MSPEKADKPSEESVPPTERDGPAVPPEGAIEISVVLPCLNEEQTVATCVEKARQWFGSARLRGEVIVVDNGSTDRSRERAREAGARVIDEPRRGYGAAHLRGFTEARGRSGPLEDLRAGIAVEITDRNQQIGSWMEEE